ncbi:MAG: hypothetical protein JST12_08915 [Armatimonadetes bacterium]|nr:hypothetical protein [Armatimonadota bacterium]
MKKYLNVIEGTWKVRSHIRRRDVEASSATMGHHLRNAHGTFWGSILLGLCLSGCGNSDRSATNQALTKIMGSDKAAQEMSKLDEKYAKLSSIGKESFWKNQLASYQGKSGGQQGAGASKEYFMTPHPDDGFFQSLIGMPEADFAAKVGVIDKSNSEVFRVAKPKMPAQYKYVRRIDMQVGYIGGVARIKMMNVSVSRDMFDSTKPKPALLKDLKIDSGYSIADPKWKIYSNGTYKVWFDSRGNPDPYVQVMSVVRFDRS